MKNNNETNQNHYIYKNILIKREYSKELEENINQLKRDLVFFLDKNKQSKKQKAKPININTQISKIINKIENSKEEDHVKLLKELQINYKRKNRRFFSAKEIDKFRERKKYLLRMINEKSKLYQTIPNKSKHGHNKNKYIPKKILNINKFNKTVFDLKNNNNNLYDNRTFHYDKSSENISLGNSNIYSSSNKYKNILKLANRNFKFKKRDTLFRPDSTKNRKTFDFNFNNHLKLNSIRDTIEDKEKIKLKKIIKDNSTVSIDYNIEDKIDPDDVYNLKKKVMLEKLKLKVDRFEDSHIFYPEDNIIYQYSISPFTFIKRTNLSQFELDIFDKEENRKFINKRKRIRKINSIAKLRFNKTQTNINRNKLSLTSKSKDQSNKSNPKVIIKKINIIKRKANNRRLKMKSLYKNKNYAKNIINYFSYDEGKMIEENLEKDIKDDVLKYKKKLGNFTYVDGKFIFSGHLKKMKP